jgi:hypothetical protein
LAAFSLVRGEGGGVGDELGGGGVGLEAEDRSVRDGVDGALAVAAQHEVGHLTTAWALKHTVDASMLWYCLFGRLSHLGHVPFDPRQHSLWAAGWLMHARPHACRVRRARVRVDGAPRHGLPSKRCTVLIATVSTRRRRQGRGRGRVVRLSCARCSCRGGQWPRDRRAPWAPE